MKRALFSDLEQDSLSAKVARRSSHRCPFGRYLKRTTSHAALSDIISPYHYATVNSMSPYTGLITNADSSHVLRCIFCYRKRRARVTPV